MMAASRAARAALAALALLAVLTPSPAAAEWKFCSPEGGHCHCFGEMRYGHPGDTEHHNNDGEFFKLHPEVTKWNKINTQGDKEPCSQATFGGDAPGADPFPGMAKFCQCNEPEARVWKACADAGEVCQCATTVTTTAADGETSTVQTKALVRATDATAAYYGVQAVDDVFTCPSDYPGAKCECLGVPEPPAHTWEWCANEGGICPCQGKIRYGSTGSNDLYASGYMKQNPDIKKFTERNIVGDISMTLCDAKSFNDEDPFPGQTKMCQCSMPVRDPDQKVLAWQWCANEGGDCTCASAARFGNTGEPGLYNERWFHAHPEVKKWSIRGDAPGTFSCGGDAFRTEIGETVDPFPGHKKICQCLSEVSPALQADEMVDMAIEIKHKDFVWCGGDGARCACNGLVRYGSTGAPGYYEDGSRWFKEHPEVMKWTYLKSYDELECSQTTFGFDPFPGHKKICQCFQGFNEEFPYEKYRPQESSSGGEGASSLGGEGVSSLGGEGAGATGGGGSTAGPWWRRSLTSR